MVSIGDYTSNTNIVLTDAVRGVTYTWAADVFEEAGTACSTVAGAAFDAASWTSIAATARVQGTGQAVGIGAAWVTLGGAGTPARFEWGIDDRFMEVAFPASLGGDGEDGANGSVEILVQATDPANTREIILFKGELIIEDSAVGVY